MHVSMRSDSYSGYVRLTLRAEKKMAFPEP